MGKIKLDELRDAYKAFFGSVYGQYLIEQIEAQEARNLKDAQDINSLDHLARSKGNREVLDLIFNVINTKGEPKE